MATVETLQAELEAMRAQLQGVLTAGAGRHDHPPNQAPMPPPVERSHALRLEPFKPNVEGYTWKAYKVKLRAAFFRARITTDADKKVALFEVIPVEFIDWLTNHFHPNDIESDLVTFENVLAVFDERFGVKDSKRYSALKFHSRKLNQGEEIDAWVMDLERWASRCNFANYLDTAIINQLVIGVPDVQLQLDLTDDDTLTKDQVIARIKHWDQTWREAAEFQTSPTPLPPSNSQPAPVLAVSGSSFGPARNVGSGSRQTKQELFCASCGGRHDRKTCRHRNAVCFGCSLTGHLASVCRSTSKQALPSQMADGRAAGLPVPARPGGAARARTASTGGRAAPLPAPTPYGGLPNPRLPQARTSFIHPVLSVGERPNTVRSSFDHVAPFEVDIRLDNVLVKFIADTGSAYTLLSEHQFHSLWPNRSWIPVSGAMKMWDGSPLKVLGSCQSRASFRGRTELVKFYVCGGNGPAILGRAWLRLFGFSLTAGNIVRFQSSVPVMHVTDANSTGNPSTDSKRAHYKDFACFQDKLGTYNKGKVSLVFKSDAKPVFLKARPVPFPRQQQVIRELDRLEKMGIITPVNYSPWATPLVIVPKKGSADESGADGPSTEIRLCGDYRSTINNQLLIDQYPLPTADQLFAQLNGATWFSKTDIRLAYCQLEVNEESALALTLNTIKGLYRVNRLAFGVAPAVAIFARTLKGELKELEGVIIFLDDVLVYADSEQELLRREEALLSRLSDLGFSLNFLKCKFGERELRYLGFRLSGSGVSPLPDRVDALHRAPAPRDVTELKSFLGHLTFYDRSCPNRATIAAPLYKLLKKGEPYVWGEEQNRAFLATKELLCSDAVLSFYSLTLPIAVGCDSSLVGCGAVLYNIENDGNLRPVMYVSKAFTETQKRWSVFEREFAACVFAVTRLHEFLAGRSFYLFTDHKPVVQFLLKRTPEITTPRVLRGLLVLGSYAIVPIYRQASRNCDADNLSRLIPPGSPEPDSEFFPHTSAVLILELNQEEGLFCASSDSPPPFSAAEVSRLTPTDPELGPVFSWCKEGWPKSDPGGVLSYYYRKRDAITIIKGCLMWGERVLVPIPLRELTLEKLHEPHLGIGKTQALARLYVWFPGITAKIEDIVNRCDTCQVSRNASPKIPVGSWGAQRRWGRLHIDFAGPFQGQYLAVLVDGETGWLEADWCPGPTASAAIKIVRSACSRFGLPDAIVSDNGPAFRSQEWLGYLSNLGVRALTTAFYAPFQNGAAERQIQSLKNTLLKIQRGSKEVKLANALALLRFVPAADGPSTAYRLLGWQPALPVSRLVPQVIRPPPASDCPFAVGDSVYFRVFPQVRYGPRWAQGVVSRIIGANGKLMELHSLQGRTVRRALQHVRARRGGSLRVPPTRPEDFLHPEQTSPSGSRNVTDWVMSPASTSRPNVVPSKVDSSSGSDDDNDNFVPPVGRDCPSRYRLRPTGLPSPQSPSEDDGSSGATSRQRRGVLRFSADHWTSPPSSAPGTSSSVLERYDEEFPPLHRPRPRNSLTPARTEYSPVSSATLPSSTDLHEESAGRSRESSEASPAANPLWYQSEDGKIRLRYPEVPEPIPEDLPDWVWRSITKRQRQHWSQQIKKLILHYNVGSASEGPARSSEESTPGSNQEASAAEGELPMEAPPGPESVSEPASPKAPQDSSATPHSEVQVTPAADGEASSIDGEGSVRRSQRKTQPPSRFPSPDWVSMILGEDPMESPRATGGALPSVEKLRTPPPGFFPTAGLALSPMPLLLSPSAAIDGASWWGSPLPEARGRGRLSEEEKARITREKALREGSAWNWCPSAHLLPPPDAIPAWILPNGNLWVQTDYLMSPFEGPAQVPMDIFRRASK